MEAGLIFVTGASGLLGANFVFAAQSQNWDITAAFHQQAICIPGVENIQVDLTDWPRVQAILESVQPTWIVHCAALTDVDRCEGQPQEARQMHVDVSRHLASIARTMQSRFVYISTDSVFDGNDSPYSEEVPPRPANEARRMEPTRGRSRLRSTRNLVTGASQDARD